MTNTATDATTSDLEQSIDIAAPPATVWALVTYLPAMSRRSPQVLRTVVLGGRVRQGARFVNLNHRGPLAWPTNGKVVRFEPHRDFAFRITENTVIWSFTLEPVEVGGRPGTRLTHRRETPTGISAVSKVLTKVALGGQQPFAAELLAGMAQTLGRLKVEAEARTV